MSSETYKDQKGRVRWHRNDEIAASVKKLGEYLIIGGYPEAHAKRYGQIAHTISRWPDSVEALAAASNLDSLPGVGGIITGYLDEIIRTGTTAKYLDNQYGEPPPLSVLELTDIERLGPKTARVLYQDYDIISLAALCNFAQRGQLNGIKGIGPKMVQTILAICAEQLA